MTGFQLGRIAILKQELSKQEALAEAKKILRDLPRIESVYIHTGRVSGELRVPRVRYVAGQRDPVTTYRENGCLYKLDVTKVMFSKGNLLERGRLTRFVNPGETIVDMFAGIGYFSIPLAKSQASKIYSIELNRDSFRFLKENIRLNNAQARIIPIQGDCRKVRIPEKADRILMGYLPGTDKFLPAAFRLLKPRGMIHYHDVFKKAELWEKPESVLKEHGEKAGFRLERIHNTRVVKTFSPGVYHIAIDAEFRKA